MNKDICILGICPNVGEPLVSLKFSSFAEEDSVSCSMCGLLTVFFFFFFETEKWNTRLDRQWKKNDEWTPYSCFDERCYDMDKGLKYDIFSVNTKQWNGFPQNFPKKVRVMWARCHVCNDVHFNFKVTCAFKILK